jgi:DNA helicase IV
LDFDDVIIDEAQDFDNGEILYFKDLAELRAGHFFVFYDKNQLLSTSEVPEWIRDSECKLLLTRNCRNTREIALTSYNVIDVELNQKAIMINGEQTSISFVEGQALPKLVRLLTLLTGDTYGYEYSDIVILSMTTEDNSLLCGVNRISGIPILRERSNSAVFFTTSRKFKGLESRVVIVTDIDDNCFIDDAKKRNFYVACSRATQKLILFVNVDESKIQAMADTINSKSRFAARGRIAMKTQSSILEL